MNKQPMVPRVFQDYVYYVLHLLVYFGPIRMCVGWIILNNLLSVVSGVYGRRLVSNVSEISALYKMQKLEAVYVCLIKAFNNGG